MDKILRFFKTHYFFLGVIVLIYAIMLFVVNPVGNFPLNDDWQYAKPVSLLLSKGTYNVTDTFPPILIVQVFWGALFCLFTGFSFTALRISTLVLGLTGVFVFYFLIYDLSKSKKISFLAALLLLINPLYFNLSNTFMTEVPFIALMLIAIFFFIKYINAPQLKFLLLATLFSVLATLIRQLGVIIPIAFALSEVLWQKQPLRQRLNYFVPAVVTFATLEIALAWLKHNVSAPPDLNPYGDPSIYSSIISLQKLTDVFDRSSNIVFYTGFLFLPLLIFFKITFFKKLSLVARLVASTVLLLIAAYFVYFYNGSQNIIGNGYLGPKTLSDTYLYNIPGHRGANFPKIVTMFVFAFGTTGAILLLLKTGEACIELSRHFRGKILSDPSTAHKKFFIALCAAIYIASLMAKPDFYDRYLLPLFPLICLVIISEPQTKYPVTIPAAVFTCLFIFMIGYYSACGTHDYLAWNSARWQAVDYLTNEKHISIHHIDGGYEVNGWLVGTGGGKVDLAKKRFGTVEDNLYMISFGEIDGCQTLQWFEYDNYLSHSTRNLYVLKTRNQ